MGSRKRLLAMVAAAGLLVAACGDDSGGSATTTAASTTAAPTTSAQATTTQQATTTAAPGSTTTAAETTTTAEATTTSVVTPPTGKPIVLALLGETNAGGTDLTGFLVGMETWAKQLNENGGLFGRPIELRRCDTKLDPTAATACAQDAAADPDVLAIVGGITGLFGPVVAPVAAKSGMLVFPGFSVSLGEANMETGFVAGVGVRGFLGGLPAYLVKEKGLTKVASIRADLDATAANADAVKAAVEAAGGEYVGDVRVPLTASDLLPAVTEAATKGAQVIIPSLTNAGAIGVLNAIRDGGYVDQIAVATSPTYFGDQAFESVVKDAGITWYFEADTTIYFDPANPAHQSYLDALKLAGIEDKGSNGQIWTAYQSGLALQKILEAAGPDLTRQSILDAALNGTFEVPGYPKPLKRGVQPEGVAYANDEIYVFQYPDQILTSEPVPVSG